MSTLPNIAVVAAGAMGAAVASRFTKAGCTVLTNLDGRSQATRQRAREAGMVDVSIADMVRRADWILSILPPRDAVSFAEKIHSEVSQSQVQSLKFADCNAVSPETVKRIAGIFAPTKIKFVDACIIGGPPHDGYDPTFYASADDAEALDDFAGLSKYGLQAALLTGEGAGVGDASALKMAYAGIQKGSTGLFTAIILAAHASSPATAQALLHEMNRSQPFMLDRLVKTVPVMLPKAYRWVGEMEEIGDFVGEGEGEVYKGMAKVFARVERSLAGDHADVDVLNKFVEDAQALVAKSK